MISIVPTIIPAILEADEKNKKKSTAKEKLGKSIDEDRERKMKKLTGVIFLPWGEELKTNKCLSCGEPVVARSMGGDAICPWCDMGKCRFCRMSVFVFKPEIDDGHSKAELERHMKWHKARLTEADKKGWYGVYG